MQNRDVICWKIRLTIELIALSRWWWIRVFSLKGFRGFSIECKISEEKKTDRALRANTIPGIPHYFENHQPVNWDDGFLDLFPTSNTPTISALICRSLRPADAQWTRQNRPLSQDETGPRGRGHLSFPCWEQQYSSLGNWPRAGLDNRWLYRSPIGPTIPSRFVMNNCETPSCPGMSCLRLFVSPRPINCRNSYSSIFLLFLWVQHKIWSPLWFNTVLPDLEPQNYTEY